VAKTASLSKGERRVQRALEVAPGALTWTILIAPVVASFVFAPYIALAIFLVTYLGFAFTRIVALIGVLFICYGLYQGIFRSVGKALASDYAPERLRASGVGWYNTTVGLSGLVASLVAGWLWDQVGHAAVFLFGAGFAVIGGIALLALVPAGRNAGRHSRDRDFVVAFVICAARARRLASV